MREIVITCSDEQFAAWDNAAREEGGHPLEAWILKMLDHESTRIAIDGRKIARLDYVRRFAARTYPR